MSDDEEEEEEDEARGGGFGFDLSGDEEDEGDGGGRVRQRLGGMFWFLFHCNINNMFSFFSASFYHRYWFQFRMEKRCVFAVLLRCFCCALAVLLL
jgi:hypothetical protein